MRSISVAALAALNLPSPKFFLLAKLITSSGDFYFSGLPYTVSFNGQTYVGSSSVISFGPPRISTTVDREIYELVVSDTSDTIQSLARTGAAGADLYVYAGLFDSDNKPLLSVDDVMIAYSGVIDNIVIVNDYESKLAKLQAASPMANLDGTGGFMASKNGMKQLAPGVTDTSFDELYTGSKSVTLRWGKS